MSHPQPTPYPARFLGRYLEPMVSRVATSRGWRQREVADWLDLPAPLLSDYLAGLAHPLPPQQQRLVRLGCDVPELRRAMLADVLRGWMHTAGLSIVDVRSAVRSVVAETAAEPAETWENGEISKQARPTAHAEYLRVLPARREADGQS